MKRYASITGGVVDTIVEQKTTPTIYGVWIDITDLNVGPGDLYDGTSFTKYMPPPDPRVVTKIAFRFRLTDSEYVSILSAAKSDVEVTAWVETFNMSTTIDLDSPRTIAGMDVLVQKNIITQSRADEILGAPIEMGER